VRLLLLEDDESTARSLAKALRRSGYEVDQAATCPDALRLVAGARFDLAVLDLMVPGGSGYEVLQALRSSETSESTTRVLILSARDRIEERVEGLSAGADDYLIKPFAFGELLARLDALLRRPSRRIENIVIGSLQIDVIHRRATVRAASLDLTRVEFDLLLALAERRGTVITRRHLLESVWGYRFDPGTNVIDVHVARLRRKLADAGASDPVRTVRGVGYVVD
jgi:two-component system OmpR family response regulator